MNPEMLLVETDHDLRNSADFLVIERITKSVTRVPGIGRVQSITRPEGKPLKFSTIPAQLSMGGTLQEMNRDYIAENHGRHVGASQRDADDRRRDDEDERVDGTDDRVTHSMVGKIRGHGDRHRRITRPHRRFR